MILPRPASELIESLQIRVTAERLARINDVIQKRNSHMSVVLENIYDRGNASAVMRSAEAFGFYQMHMIELGEKFKESKRVTKGADKWLDIKKWKSTKSCVEELRAQGRKIYVTHLQAKALPLSEVNTDEPFALCFGNEKDGASKELLELSDGAVYIPMQGFVESFNISVAAAICFYHFQNKTADKKISTEEMQNLKAYYLIKSVEHWEKYL